MSKITRFLIRTRFLGESGIFICKPTDILNVSKCHISSQSTLLAPVSRELEWSPTVPLELHHEDRSLLPFNEDPWTLLLLLPYSEVAGKVAPDSLSQIDWTQVRVLVEEAACDSKRKLLILQKQVSYQAIHYWRSGQAELGHAYNLQALRLKAKIATLSSPESRAQAWALYRSLSHFNRDQLTKLQNYSHVFITKNKEIMLSNSQLFTEKAENFSSFSKNKLIEYKKELSQAKIILKDIQISINNSFNKIQENLYSFINEISFKMLTNVFAKEGKKEPQKIQMPTGNIPSLDSQSLENIKKKLPGWQKSISEKAQKIQNWINKTILKH